MFTWYIKNKKRTVWIAIIWTVLIFIACLIPGNEVPDVKIPLIDKYVHFVIFGSFSFLWLCTIPLSKLSAGIWIFIISVAVGYLVELLQGSGITTGRSYDLYDVIADAIGGIIGVFVFFITKKITRHKHKAD